MKKFHLLVGIVSFILGLIPILDSYGKMPFNISIPPEVYYYVLLIAGVLLIAYGSRKF